jgi:hypothetical protein
MHDLAVLKKLNSEEVARQKREALFNQTIEVLRTHQATLPPVEATILSELREARDLVIRLRAVKTDTAVEMSHVIEARLTIVISLLEANVQHGHRLPR